MLSSPDESQDDSEGAEVASVDQDVQIGCTAVRLTAPIAGFVAGVGVSTTLTAVATCPVGVTPEYQFWVKSSASSSWQTLPGFTTGSSSWTPSATGTWNVKAVARTVGSHVNYQVGSSSVTVTVAP